MRRFPNILAATIALLAATNAVLLAFLGTYDFYLGPVHLFAHGLFKPLLYLSGAALLGMLLRSSSGAQAIALGDSWSPPPWMTAILIALLYAPSLTLNPPDPLNDWFHRADTEHIHSLGELLGLFAWRQPDGFYRPLTFVSLWLDRVIFGSHDWGYHLQNIGLHVANALLVVRLALRLRLATGAARWAGLLFGVAAIAYEPVIWPGARFDLLAGFFVLLALLAAFQYLAQPRPESLVRLLVFFVLSVFSKESAYCVPPLFALFCWTHSRIRASIPALLAVAATTLAMLAIRVAIFNGLGGYPAVGGAPHFALSLKTFTSFFTRALPAPLFLLNTDADLGGWARLAIVTFALWVVMQAFTSGGSLRHHSILVTAALASALPAANLVDWIGPIALNVRYLYLTSLWIFLLAASAAWSSTRGRKALALLAIANTLGVIHNVKSFEWYPALTKPAAQTTGPETARVLPR